ncbi:CDP-diacylglycerol--serine O-phosphatidyltransferase [Terasakiispira papahanaumokuakeensis]|uniref:CDP-diacylglycerol--serine O-phosphatidyltransferase n=1 Tax=Terasakiispira papahanaumokuakeensis TaxID=197479 RepID=A0A1E2VC15_9GAMM|nr:CDP-diacylglycerol--serine O-phosphatidyltransferase [Terasakiispira papahanaumokuakeensis]ODC04529.1 CDP-diacylglycerol--serine O-phosphatidyltransferase [Terasakiispira papahanaumokuakeensis]
MSQEQFPESSRDEEQVSGAQKSSEQDKKPSGFEPLSDIDLVDEVVEETVEDGQRVKRRGIYLLPNLFTTGALFSGFYAIVSAMNGTFDVAAIAIFVSMILDGLDGRVARMTNTQSAFGAEYDSLADMVSFGVAPALVSFSWLLKDLGKFGWIAAFIYVAGAALRLARFNVQIGSVDKRWFIGLPSPSAAAIVAGMVWTLHDYELTHWAYQVLAGAIVAAAGLLMVSNVRYYSFKDLDLKGRVPFVMLLVLVLVFAIVSIDPATILLVFFLGYGVSGPLRALLRR